MNAAKCGHGSASPSRQTGATIAIIAVTDRAKMRVCTFTPCGALRDKSHRCPRCVRLLIFILLSISMVFSCYIPFNTQINTDPLHFFAGLLAGRTAAIEDPTSGDALLLLRTPCHPCAPRPHRQPVWDRVEKAWSGRGLGRWSRLVRPCRRHGDNGGGTNGNEDGEANR